MGLSRSQRRGQPVLLVGHQGTSAIRASATVFLVPLVLVVRSALVNLVKTCCKGVRPLLVIPSVIPVLLLQLPVLPLLPVHKLLPPVLPAPLLATPSAGLRLIRAACLGMGSGPAAYGLTTDDRGTVAEPTATQDPGPDARGVLGGLAPAATAITGAVQDAINSLGYTGVAHGAEVSPTTSVSDPFSGFCD